MSFHRHIQIDSRRHVELRVDGVHVFEDQSRPIYSGSYNIHAPGPRVEIVIPWEILDEINAKRP